MWMDDWSSWYITHHPRQKMKVPQFSSIHPWVAYIIIDLPHIYTHRWIDRVVNTSMTGWISWYITHHPRQEQEVCQFSYIHPWYILRVLCGQYACYYLSWLLVQWCINLTHPPIDGLTWVSTPVCMIGVHGTSHTTQDKSKKCASVHPSMQVHLWSVDNFVEGTPNKWNIEKRRYQRNVLM